VDTNRYKGKPMLRLLELYVLWAIGELTSDDDARLEAMAPKLQQTLGGDGTWQGALASTMHFPATMPEAIRDLWERNSGIAKANGERLDSQRFAEMFVDANLIG
jgi:hypothetical protein